MPIWLVLSLFLLTIGIYALYAHFFWYGIFFTSISINNIIGAYLRAKKIGSLKEADKYGQKGCILGAIWIYILPLHTIFSIGNIIYSAIVVLWRAKKNPGCPPEAKSQDARIDCG